MVDVHGKITEVVAFNYKAASDIDIAIGGPKHSAPLLFKGNREEVRVGTYAEWNKIFHPMSRDRRKVALIIAIWMLGVASIYIVSRFQRKNKKGNRSNRH